MLHPILGNISVDELKPNQMLMLFLMSSYAYYHRFDSLMADEEFDSMCKVMIDRWDEIDHEHKYLVKIEDLKAGTGYAIKYADYPTRVRVGADDWMRELEMRRG